MEMCLANLIEPGDQVLVGVSGYAERRGNRAIGEIGERKKEGGE